MSQNNKSFVKNFSVSGASKLNEMTENPAVYVDFLKFQGRVFKHTTNVSLEFFAQRPEAKFIATEKQWENANMKLFHGSKAIRFLGQDGKILEYYDFSQVNKETPPTQWSLNQQNSVLVKNELGIPKDKLLISEIIKQNINISDITSSMETLKIAPQDYQAFQKSFLKCIQLTIAGRLEVGGSTFTIPPDLSALKFLDTEEKKFAFLTHTSKFARKSLMQIENAVNITIAKERIDQNDIRGMGNSNIGRTGENSRLRTTKDTTGTTEEQQNQMLHEEGEQRTGVGINSSLEEREQHEVVSSVQTGVGSRPEDMVQVRTSEWNLHNESNRNGSDTGGRTDNRVWSTMDAVHGGTLQSSSGMDVLSTQIPNSSTLSSQESDEIQGLTGQTVRTDDSTSRHEQLRNTSQVGESERVPFGLNSNERDSSSSSNGSLENNIDKTSIALEIEQKEQDLATFIKEKEYPKAEILLKEITDLNNKAKLLKEKTKEPIIENSVDIDTIKTTQPQEPSPLLTGVRKSDPVNKSV